MVKPRERILASRRRPRLLDVEQRIKLRLTWFRRFYVFVWVELNSKVRIPWRIRLKAWRRGFQGTSWALYELDDKNLDEYLRDHCFRNYSLFDRHRSAIMEKLTFAHLMHSLGVPQPRPLAFVLEGRLLELGDALRATGQEVNVSVLLDRADGLVFRHVGGWGGRGVFFVRRGDKGLLLDDQPASPGEVEERIRGLDQYLITEFLENADYVARISQPLPATLRVLTIWDIERGEPFIAAASQKISYSSTERVDSYRIGGECLVAEVDLASGRLGPGLNIDSRGRLLSLSHHPVTGAPIEGIDVTHWGGTKEILLRTAASLPQFPLVGWDILMTNDGPRWLEGNSPTGINLWQAHTPLLRDPRSRAFFEWLGAA